MYAVWWSIALVMICSYVVLEVKLWRAGVERVYGGNPVTLPGRRWYYRWGAFGVGFLGFTSVMLGILDYAGIKFETAQGTVCWLAGVLLVGLVNRGSVEARLKYFEFDRE